MQTNQQWRLKERPDGLFKESDFEWREEGVPELTGRPHPRPRRLRVARPDPARVGQSGLLPAQSRTRRGDA